MTCSAYQASSAQKRLYLVDKLIGKSVLYNIPNVWIIKGKLETEKLESAMRQMIKRHETLRTSFTMKKEKVLQKVDTHLEFKLKYSELNEVPPLKVKSKLDSLITNLLKPFDIHEAPLWRMELIQVNKQFHILYFDIHHIISDGTSMGILLQEMLDLYLDKQLLPLKYQYVDFTMWQNKMFEHQRAKNQEKYWLDIYKEEIPVLELPTDFPRTMKPDFSGNTMGFRFESSLTRKVKQLSIEGKTTLYVILLVGYTLFLSKYSSQEDIVVGTPASGRTHPEFERIIGMFVNTLALRNQPSSNKTIKNYIHEVSEKTFSAFDNQDYQFEMLVEKTVPERQLNRNPIFDTMLALQNYTGKLELEDLDHQKLRFIPYPFEDPVSKFDLTLFAFESRGEIHFKLEYRTSLFREETIHRMCTLFRNIVEEIVQNPGKKISEIEMISPQEKEYLLSHLNNSKDKDECQKTGCIAVHQLFENKVDARPNTIVLLERVSNHMVTYANLQTRATILAQQLAMRGVGLRGITGVLVEPSIQWIRSILAVLKTGGVYMPMNINLPKTRIQLLLADSQCQMILGRKKYMEQILYEGSFVELEDKINYEVKEQFRESSHLKPGTPMYMIYTSGSAGRPKGVLLEHLHFLNLMNTFRKKTPIDFTKKVLQFASPGFDVSVQEVFSTLISGGQLCIPGEKTKHQIHQLMHFISRVKISILFLPPSYIRMLFSKNQEYRLPGKISHIISAGEQLTIPPQFREYIIQNQVTLHNHYGPTETHVVTTLTIPPRKRNQEYPETPTIGTPISQVNIYVLDKNKKIQPIGVPGELYITGSNVARGYINRPEVTAESFLPDPFIEGKRMYRTGDRGRWNSQGEIEFFGRQDRQIKVRGFRVEPGEIEAQLLAHEKVRQAWITARREGGETSLCAYIVTENITGTHLPGELTEYLLKRLPGYMVPAYFVPIEKIPLTANGKVNEQALPEPVTCTAKKNDTLAPSDEMEIQLQGIWKEVLKLKDRDKEFISLNENFFQLGGHSLTAILMISEIKKKLNTDIPMAEIFKHPCLKDLSQYIKENRKIYTRPVQPAEEREYYPLTSSQKRMYFLQKMEEKQVSYNLPTLFTMEQGMAEEKITAVLTNLLQRHESLRTSFHLVNGDPVQRVKSSLHIQIDLCKRDLTKESCSEPESGPMVSEIEKEISQFIRPFDLQTAPLFRIKIIKKTEETSILLFDIHHIISDGLSMKILMEEFITLYQGNRLREPFIRYIDYAIWRTSFPEEEEKYVKKQEAFWLRKFNRKIPVLQLPTDYSRPAVQSFEGGMEGILLSSGETAQLIKLAGKENSTLFLLLLGAFSILLSNLSKQEEIVVGTPVLGRRQPELQTVIGLFVNTLALRNQIKKEKSFRDFLKNLTKETMESFDHQDYPFEDLVEKITKAKHLYRDTSKNPIFDTVISMQNIKVREIQGSGEKHEPYKYLHNTSKFDLTLYPIEKKDHLELSLEYCTRLFKKSTIERYLRYLKKILTIVTREPDICLGDIDMLSPEEKDLLLIKFNQINEEYQYPGEKTLTRIFETQAIKRDQAIAITLTPMIDTPGTQENQITYIELNSRANQVGKKLLFEGVKPDMVVALIFEPSIEMIIGIMAVLKAGAAYMPIEPKYPTNRKRYMLQDSAAILILHAGKRAEKGQKQQGESLGKVKKLDILNLKNKRKNSGFPEQQTQPGSVAYIIYTSGTTGFPKGTLIEHRNVVQLLFNRKNPFHFSLKDTWTMSHSYCFDFSVWEMYGALLYGGRLELLSKMIPRIPRRFLEVLIKSKTTILNQTPSSFYNLVQEDIRDDKRQYHLKYIIFGGEALKPLQLKRWKERYPEIRMINMFGITETTVHVTFKELTMNDIQANKSTIGKPLPIISTYVLDEDRKLMPINVPGEMCVGGEGVARGYLNRPQLTSEKFIQNPYRKSERIYQSGDEVRIDEKGNLEYLGRIDHQVKIRGHRIELKEIEHQLLKYPKIRETVVLVKEGSQGETYLCAYYVVQSDDTGTSALEVNKLREHLSRELPDYMVPSFFYNLEHMPVTPNSKVDRDALLSMESAPEKQKEYCPPRNDLEVRMINILSKIIDLQNIGINDDFFELGGNSMTVIRFTHEITREFGVEIPIVEVFKDSRIKSISRYIFNQSRNLKEEPIIQLNKPGKMNLFCFPPGSGLGIAFKKISTLLYEYSVFGFNFIQESDRIERYTALIKDVQPRGPYILFGYSSGGNLAFEVAKGLEKRGNKVSDIILLDSVRKLNTRKITKKEVKSFELFMRADLQYYSDYQCDMDKLVENGIQYNRYFNEELINNGQVKANLHLVYTKPMENRYHISGEWGKATEGRFNLYMGDGYHGTMLKEGSIERNSAIIISILSEISGNTGKPLHEGL